MERLNQMHLSRPSIYAEHAARYEWVARFLKGQDRIIDCACGEGYGSYLLSQHFPDSEVIGFDVSKEALLSARANFQAENLHFQQSSIEDLCNYVKNVDCLVSFETLEHTQVPSKAVQSIRHVMSDEGLLLGSVPSAYYEDACTEIFGPNIHHRHKFSKADLEELLLKEFECVWIGVAVFGLGTIFIGSDDQDSQDQVFSDSISLEEPMGSFVFIASNSTIRFNNALNDLTKAFYFGVGFAQYFSDEVNPLFETIDNIESLVRDRDSYIKDLESKVFGQAEYIESVESIISEKDNYISNLETKMENRERSLLETIKDIEKLVKDRDSYIKDLEEKNSDQVESIKRIESLVDERDSYISYLEKNVKDFRDVHNSLKHTENLVGERDLYIQSLEKRVDILTEENSAKSEQYAALRDAVHSLPLLRKVIDRKLKIKGSYYDK